ncbi:MAG: hypothetical protein JSW20_00375 [Nitrospiraceae bacterium]|nr:MAG: hypothetical protein JSW20_00375 [Nitrospiraceae bacterium]
MKKILLVAFLLITALIFTAGDAFSAWTQPKGYAYNQLSFSYYKTNEKWTTLGLNADGEVIDLDVDVEKTDTEDFTSTKISYYSEYGIIDKLTIFYSFGYDWQKSDDVQKFTDENGPSGIGDIDLGLRYHLMDNIAGTGILSSAQVKLKIPEAYDYGNPVTKLSLGDGQYDATFALLFGRGFSKGYAWLNAGYKYRFENKEHDPITFKPSDQVKVSFGGGYPLLSWLSIGGLVDWTKSVGNAEVSDELLIANYPAGGKTWHGDTVVIKDSLGLEPSALSLGVDLIFDISKFVPVMKETFPSKSIVFSFVTDVAGFGPFKTEDYSLGRTYSVAFVFPGKGFFPVNLF